MIDIDGTILPILYAVKGEIKFSEYSPRTNSPTIDLSNISKPNSPNLPNNIINVAIGMLLTFNMSTHSLHEVTIHIVESLLLKV